MNINKYGATVKISSATLMHDIDLANEMRNQQLRALPHTQESQMCGINFLVPNETDLEALKLDLENVLKSYNCPINSFIQCPLV